MKFAIFALLVLGAAAQTNITATIADTAAAAASGFGEVDAGTVTADGIATATDKNKNIQRYKKSKYLNEDLNGPLSSQWAPRLIHDCVPNAEINSAPCLQNIFGREKVSEAYDILYEGFKLREPIFGDEKDRASWLNMKTPTRFTFENFSDDGIVWARFYNFTGSNFVLRGASWTGLPWVLWGDYTCLDGYQKQKNVVEMIQSLLKYYINNNKLEQNYDFLDNSDSQQKLIYAEMKNRQIQLQQEKNTQHEIQQHKNHGSRLLEGENLEANQNLQIHQIQQKNNQNYMDSRQSLQGENFEANQKLQIHQIQQKSNLESNQKLQIYQILKQRQLNSTQFEHLNDIWDELPEYESVVFVATPDSWSFQHFLDRSSHTFIQSEEIFRRRGSGSIVLNSLRNKMQPRVLDLWKFFGIDEERQIYISDANNTQGVKARNYIDACRTVLVHPYMALRMREIFPVSTNVPLSEKKVVLFMSRDTRGVVNGGRRIVNLRLLLHALNEMLSERNQGEQLMLFVDGNYTTHELVRWMSTHVRAMIGPHGGAIYNHRFMGGDSLLYELSPTSRTSTMFWTQASMLGQKYIFTHCKTLNDKEDMVAPVHTIVNILNTHLGKPLQSSPIQRLKL